MLGHWISIPLQDLENLSRPHRLSVSSTMMGLGSGFEEPDRAYRALVFGIPKTGVTALLCQELYQ